MNEKKSKPKFTHPAHAPEGHRWTTSDGGEVGAVAAFNVEKYNESIAAVVDGAIHLFYEDGHGEGIILIDAPQKEVTWRNVYPAGVSTSEYPTRLRCDIAATSDRIAVQRIEVTEEVFE